MGGEGEWGALRQGRGHGGRCGRGRAAQLLQKAARAAGAGQRDASTGGRRAMAAGLRAEGRMEGGSRDVEGREGRETGDGRGKSRCGGRVELIGAARKMGGGGGGSE